MASSTLFLFVLALPYGACHAFGALGHQVVAEIAARHLDPRARAAVEQLLGDKASPAMRQASTWADEIKGRPDFERTGSLHFVNLDPQKCRYNPSTDCRGGHCIVAALGYFVEQLRSAPNAAERADALRWVIQLVADAAQPLHAYGADRGGNLLQVRVDGRGSNLHHVWDSSLLEDRHLDAIRYADAMDVGTATQSVFAWDPSVPIRWVEDSCSAVTPDAYHGGPIDAAYVQRYRPAIEKRVRAAGFRLAALLNTVFAL